MAALAAVRTEAGATPMGCQGRHPPTLFVRFHDGDRDHDRPGADARDPRVPVGSPWRTGPSAGRTPGSHVRVMVMPRRVLALVRLR
jgi:hypothetical protein